MASLAVGHALLSPWVPGLQSAGSVAVAHQLSCSKARGIFLGQESNLCVLNWQVDSLPLSHQENPKISNFQNVRKILYIYTRVHTHTLDINTHKAFIYV